MFATLDIPEREIKFEFENLTYNQFRMIGRKPSKTIPMLEERFPIGEPITLITSNMPEELKNTIVNLIEKYCNH